MTHVGLVDDFSSCSGKIHSLYSVLFSVFLCGQAIHLLSYIHSSKFVLSSVRHTALQEASKTTARFTCFPFFNLSTSYPIEAAQITRKLRQELVGRLIRCFARLFSNFVSSFFCLIIGSSFLFFLIYSSNS